MKQLRFVVALALVHCSPPPRPCDTCVDAGTADSGMPFDAGADDAGAVDAGVHALDASTEADAGTPDANVPDGGAPDAAIADAGTPDASVADSGTDAGTFARIRLMAANLTAGNAQNYDTPPGDTPPGPGIRLMQGARPDIVMLQEFRISPDDTQARQAMADAILGAGASVCRETVDGPGDIPNGIISRWPILSCGEWPDSRITNRDYAYARIDVPGPKDLWAISVHFSTNLSIRPTEAAEVVMNVMTNIPAGDFVVLGGDLNTDDVFETAYSTLTQVFTIVPQPTDQFGNPGTNTNRLIRLPDGGLDPMRNKPYDWVMPTPELQAHEVPVTLTDGVQTLTMPNGLIIDTRVFDAGTIGLIAPALLQDSAAPNMQHMGVIRDFDLPL